MSEKKKLRGIAAMASKRTLEEEKALIFVQHIKAHFEKEHPDWKVCCKICGKNIDEIYEERMKEIEAEQDAEYEQIKNEEEGRIMQEVMEREEMEFQVEAESQAQAEADSQSESDSE